MNICEEGICCIAEHGEFWVHAKEGKGEGVMQLCFARKCDWNPFVFCSSFHSLGYVCFTLVSWSYSVSLFYLFNHLLLLSKLGGQNLMLPDILVLWLLFIFTIFFPSAERFSLILFYYYSNRNIYRICRVAKWMLQLESYTFMAYFKLQS